MKIYNFRMPYEKIWIAFQEFVKYLSLFRALAHEKANLVLVTLSLFTIFMLLASVAAKEKTLMKVFVSLLVSTVIFYFTKDIFYSIIGFFVSLSLLTFSTVILVALIVFGTLFLLLVFYK